MATRATVIDGVCKLILPKRFDFSEHRNFRETYTLLLADVAVKKFQIDFSETDYIDSAALGMLLLFRRIAKEKGLNITLAGARGVVAEVLQVAKFETLFD